MTIRALGASLILAVALYAAVSAQQVSESVNVMPVWVPCDLATDSLCATNPAWSNAWRFGDIFLQRQVEPSLAPSTLNPDHLLTAFIDYSAVEKFNDTAIGGGVIASNGWGWLRGLLAKLVGRPRERPRVHEEDEAVPEHFAGSEAWIRLTWSINGGATGTPFFMPGWPLDTSSAAPLAPYFQIADGTSDPVVVAAPNGDFHVIYMAFKRGSFTWLMDGRFRDLNIPDDPRRHSLALQGFTTLTSGNNSTFGLLADKPHALVVPDASGSGYTLYVSWTLFTGNPGGGKFQAHIYVAKSTDGGFTFTTEKISQSTIEISGTWLVNTKEAPPRVIAFWRGFGSSPTIFYSKQGDTSWSKPVSILGKTYPTLAAFDQINRKVDATNSATLSASEQNITPRSNAFPTAALAADGTIFVAWQECVNVNLLSSTFREPLACSSGGSPRIVLMYLPQGQTTFLPDRRKAVDITTRSPEANGLGYFWNVGRDNNFAHPQLMPALACTVNQCILTYWESRQASLTADRQIGGYHSLIDLRGALLNPDGTVARSFQISRYPYRPGTKLVGTQVLDSMTHTPRDENVNDVDRMNEIISANGTRSCAGPAEVSPPLSGLDSGCVPRLNFYCRPQSGGGTTCFMGDYNAVVPSTSFVLKNGSWQAPTTLQVQDVPWVGFLTASSDNRNLIPPAAPLPSKGGLAPNDQLSQYTAWTHGLNGLPACTVGGSRNTDTLLAKVSLGLLVTTSVTSKTTPSPGDEPFITFPLQVWNNSNALKSVTLTIDTLDTSTSHSSFSKTATVKAGAVTINAYSSTSRVVYVTYPPPTAVSPIHVTVTDGTSITGVTFNAAGTQPNAAGSSASSLTVSDPVTLSAENLSAENLSAENLSAKNLSAENLSAENLSAVNLSAENLSAENLGISETTWVIQASGDPTKPYSALPHIDTAFLADYNFKMVIYRLSSIGACVDVNGATRQYQATVVANTGTANLSAENLSAENLSAENLSAENGFPSDPVVNNSIFTPKPHRQVQGVVASADCRIGECVEAQPPEREFTVVRLLAIPNKPLSQIGRRYSATAPASVTVADYWCDPKITDPKATGFCQRVQKGADLVVGALDPITNMPINTPILPTATPTTVRAGQTVTFPAANYLVPNNGNFAAGPRRYGFYLSRDTTLDTSTDVLLGFFNPAGTSSCSPPTQGCSLAAGSADTVPAQTLTIPRTTTPTNTTWHLILYADDLRQVSELKESNNIAAVPITVLPPEYGFSGLLSPCLSDAVTGADCVIQGNGTLPVAWQFTDAPPPPPNGGQAVDSLSTPPRLLFYRSNTGWSEGALLATVVPPNNVDIAPGSSGFQYCNPLVASPLCASRPRFTWQYNWQRLDPGTGATLFGNYLLYIEVDATGQTRANSKAIGPIRITLK